MLVFQGLSAQDLVDFSPVYRCLHIYSVLVSRVKSKVFSKHILFRMSLPKCPSEIVSRPPPLFAMTCPIMLQITRPIFRLSLIFQYLGHHFVTLCCSKLFRLISRRRHLNNFTTTCLLRCVHSVRHSQRLCKKIDFVSIFQHHNLIFKIRTHIILSENRIISKYSGLQFKPTNVRLSSIYSDANINNIVHHCRSCRF